MVKPENSKIAIIGLGLIGGSLGLALVKAGFSVSGWDEDVATRREAFKIGAINQETASFADTITDAGVVFIATPVSLIPQIIKEALPYSRPGTIFSDLGSIKGVLMRDIYSFLPETHFFVPGHPMTGSEQNGIKAADPFLFQNVAYLIIEDPRVPETALNTIIELVAATGALLLKLTADEHDRIVGMVSHLPHLIAATLAKTAGEEESDHPGTLRLAAGGFRDTTRVATGSPELWEGIILGNRAQALRALDGFQAELEQLRKILQAGDGMKLRRFLSSAREVRMQIPAKNKGFITLLYEMVVTVEDRPGAINEVLCHLANEGINIKDIEILRVREGSGGTLRLALENSDAVESAVQVLQDKGFKVRRR